VSHPHPAGKGGATSAGAGQMPASRAAAAARVPPRRGRAADGKTAPAVLITGCSSGSGHAAALRLHAAGFAVYATARRPEALGDLAAGGITTARLDVTDEQSMTAVVGQITAEHGAVGVLVNNAGFELAGPVEEVPLAQVRRLFETNLFGLARLTQLAIPGMRLAGHGTIINLSSVFGRFAVPGNAYYAATKHAVGAFTDTLRLELDAFGIRVVLIEPTAARTRLNDNTAWAASSPDGPGPPRNIAGRLAVTPGQVAAAITKAATSRRPRARYPVGILARVLFALRRWLPGPAFDAFLRTQFPAPRQTRTPASAGRLSRPALTPWRNR